MDDITDHLDTWKALEIQHEDEKGDVEAATGLINSLKDELEALIVQGRYFVNSILMEVEVEGIDEHDIEQDFGAEGKIPDGVEALVRLGRQMAAMNANYIDDGSPYAMPAADFEEIGTVAEALSDALDARKVEHREQMHIGRLKEIERKRGDRLLSRAFRWTCAVWDYNDVRLEDLGFVPKSQIHTPGDPPLDWPDWPGPAMTFIVTYLGMKEVQVDYSGVKEATIGWLHRRIPGTEDWILVDDALPMSPEGILPLRERDVPPGIWEYRFIPMRGDEHGEASYAIVEVVV